MTPAAHTQQAELQGPAAALVEPEDEAAADAAAPERDAPHLQRRRRRVRRWLFRGAILAFLIAWGVIGARHATKPLLPGTRVASLPVAVLAGQVELLLDTTTADAFGQPIVEQRIFDETLRLIGAARRFIVLDQFLFNDYGGAPIEPLPLRHLSGELTGALLAAKRARPNLRILLITDPINDVYGGAASPALAALRRAGVEVVITNLDGLRDSNPLYSGFWRLAIQWWNVRSEGEGWLPHPLDQGPDRVPFGAWARLLNFKANHRKVVIADDGGNGIAGIVGSANPHDASSAHSNAALLVRGEALRPLFESEVRIARFSGWRGVPILLPVGPVSGARLAGAEPPRSALRSRAAAGASGAARARNREDEATLLLVSVLTEGAIRDALLERIGATQAGDHIDLAMFYLAERSIIEALIAASGRGVDVRVLLDPNRDAFGRAKSGIPNRPVASELVSRSDGAIKLRWYRTHGEQFHPKLVAVRTADRLWLTLGSANLTRRNIGDFNLEANLAVEAPADAALATSFDTWFETLWFNRAPVGIEYTADFGTFADPAQSRYWAYRIMEASGLSTF